MKKTYDDIENLAFELPDYPDDLKKLFKETGDFIRELPLSAKQNDILVEMLVENVESARINGFSVGFGTALGYGGAKIKRIDEQLN